MSEMAGRELLLPRWLEDELAAAAALHETERGQELAGRWRQALERARSDKEDQERGQRSGHQAKVDEDTGDFGEPKRTRRAAVRLFDPKELEAFRGKLARHHSASGDRDRAKAVIKELSDLGPWREPLRGSRAILGKLQALRCECPNFAEVVDHVRASLVLYRGAVVLQPLLLDGPAGVGKTYFASRMAEAFGTPFRRVDMGATTASFALVGSDKAYENSQTGCLFDVLASSTSCAPVILLDELCKAAGDARYPVTAVLYGLLEPLTAATFRDASMPQIALDCRYVVWLATSNNAGEIPEPLLNRMRVFNIATPTVDQMREVIRRIAAVLWRATGRRARAPLLGERVLDRLCQMPVRSAKLAITEAFAKAVMDDRTALELDDLPSEAPPPRRMGFV